MFILLFLLTGVLGLYFGSFITAVAMRVSNAEKVFVKHSTCDSCNTRIGFLYLIPIIGLLFCKGKCKHCNTKVSLEYVIYEILHALLWCVNLYIFDGNPLLFGLACAVSSALVLIAIIDIKTMYVYDVHLVVLFALLLCLNLARNKFQITFTILQIATCKAMIPLAFKVLYEKLRWLITKEKMVVLGMGDVKLFGILFFLLDFYYIPFFIALSGAFGMLFFIITTGRNSTKYYPFVPSIALAVYFFFIVL